MIKITSRNLIKNEKKTTTVNFFFLLKILRNQLKTR